MPEISIIEATTAVEVAAAEQLLRDYQLWMRRRHAGHLALIDAYFDEQEWQSELADLVGHYGAPHGSIVLALVDGAPAGCVILRGIGEYVSEMKRLFVRPAFRGLGLAKQLITRAMKVSCRCGYKLIRFETEMSQTEAEALYRSLDFARIPPYYGASDLLRRNGLFYEARPCAA